MNSRDEAARSSARRWWFAALAVLVLAAVGTGAAYVFGRNHHSVTHSATNAKQAMADRAQQVMPFDLSRTMHTFTKTANGGLQRVVVNDPTDTRDLTLVRSHLRTEAEQFRNGNYTDPAKIHGMDMPGVSDLEAGAARVKVDYAEIPNGAQITYSSTEPGLISSLHDWFDRQASDHSMPGMGG